MAIEILKRGVLKRKFFLGTCRSCTTQVRFLEEDALTTCSDQRDGEYATVECPVCEETIFGYPRVMDVE